MCDSFVLSYKILDADTRVDIFNPGYRFRIDRSDPTTLQAIADVVPDSVHTVHMPSPVDANARITNLPLHMADAFIVAQEIGGKYITSANDHYDGAVLDLDEGFAVTSADCPTIVLHGRDKQGELHVVAAHAGRDSLLNKDMLSKGIAVPGIVSSGRVIYNAVLYLSQMGVDVENIHLNVYCGIRTGFYHPPDHPAHGRYNRALLDTCQRYGAKYGIVRDWDAGEVDMYRLIKAQAAHLGVTPTNVVFDDIDTGDPSQGWASRRRPGSWERDERNLVIVSRPKV